MWNIFNKGKKTTGSYKTKTRAEYEVKQAVKRSNKNKMFEPQKKSDYTITKKK